MEYYTRFHVAITFALLHIFLKLKDCGNRVFYYEYHQEHSDDGKSLTSSWSSSFLSHLIYCLRDSLSPVKCLRNDVTRLVPYRDRSATTYHLHLGLVKMLGKFGIPTPRRMVGSRTRASVFPNADPKSAYEVILCTKSHQ